VHGIEGRTREGTIGALIWPSILNWHFKRLIDTESWAVIFTAWITVCVYHVLRVTSAANKAVFARC
jgi:hypothetical protein